MRFSREGISACSRCPLARKTRVWGHCDVPSPKMAFFGEAPGEQEDREGEPFVGPAGRLLTQALVKCSIMRRNAWVGNVLSCRPPGNKLDSAEGIEALECCRKGFLAEVAMLRKAGVRVFVPLGGFPMEQLLDGQEGIYQGIYKLRGSVFLLGKVPVVPTFHPSHLLQGAMKEQGTWMQDILKARALSQTVYKPPRENFNLQPTLGDLEALRDRTRGKWIGVDIETTGLNVDYAKIVVVGIAESSERATVIPFLCSGGRRFWSMGDEQVAWELVDEILQGGKVVIQNALFDVPILEKSGCSEVDVAFDTMLAHHCLTGDTIIDTLDFGKVPVRDLEGKQGFWVVSHNGENLVPKKAKVCWKSGRRNDLVRVVFWSKSRADKSKMWIDCTRDHEFPVQGKAKKVQAQELKPGDRLFPGQMDNTRIEKKRIHRWVYESENGSLRSKDIHHVDGNHGNNRPDNLLLVTKAEHNRFHKDVQYRATLAGMQEAAKRREGKADPCEVARLYFDVGLSYREVAQYLSCDVSVVRSTLVHSGRKMRSRSEARHLAIEKGKNCRVISVVPLATSGEDVYDIEVPETHTFSANGVIVGNCVHPELPHRLGYLVSVYGKTPYWKGEFLGRESSILNMPDDTLRTYNARDAVVLLQIRPVLDEDLVSQGTKEVFEDIALRLIRPVIDMTRTGLPLDQTRLTSWTRKQRAKLKAVEKRLVELSGVPSSFNFDSDQDRDLLFHGELANKFEDAKRTADEYEVPGTRKKKGCGRHKKALELVHMAEAVQPLVLPNGYTQLKTKTGLWSYNENAMVGLFVACNNRIAVIGKFVRRSKEHEEEAEGLKKTKRIVMLFEQKQELTKLVSTYTSFPVGMDGRVHPRFKISETTTGRLASGSAREYKTKDDKVNIQNIPKSARKLFKARDGWVIMEPDWKNLELIILAEIAHDVPLLGVFRKGANVHDQNTRDMFGIEKDDAHWGKQRDNAKRTRFGRNYGGGKQGIYKRLIKESWHDAIMEDKEECDFTMTFREFSEAEDRYMREHPAQAKWMKDVETELTTSSPPILRNVFGRVRIFLGTYDEIQREGLNFPIQSTAADLANLALIALYWKLRDGKYRARLIAQVHDSFVLEVPEGEVKAVARIVKEVMEKSVRIGKRNVSFPIELKVGPSWGELKEYTVEAKRPRAVRR